MPADLLPRGVHELPLFAPPTVLVAVTHSHAFFDFAIVRAGEDPLEASHLLRDRLDEADPVKTATELPSAS